MITHCFLKQKMSFIHKLKKLNMTMNNFTWEIPNHDDTFEQNVINSILNCLNKPRKHLPKSTKVNGYIVFQTT